MKAVLKWIAVGMVVAVAGFAAFLFYEVRSMTVERVTDDLHMIKGLGGNVAVLKTGAGTVIVDTMTFAMQGSRIRHIAEGLTGEPIVLVINTHYHSDHTHGNPGFRPGTQVVSTTRTLEHLHEIDGSYWTGDAAALLPNHTFEHDLEIQLGTKHIDLLHPGRGHTDGDLVVLFVDDDTLHTGDLFFNHLYPNIDLEAGGTVRDWGDTLDNVLALKFTHVIPGHGELSDRDGLAQFQRFMRQLAAVGANAKAQGLTVDATVRGAQLTEDAGYSPIEIPLVMALNRDFVIRRSWEEATRGERR
ncbi:MAG TPA: MBL fold metallo-hydrolase [Pseudomonadales bacterium]|nr:MBL fold metallo-hydrolase [Pseudomonadales bacterium]